MNRTFPLINMVFSFLSLQVQNGGGKQSLEGDYSFGIA